LCFSNELPSAVCRAFQGIGGSGIYAVAMVMLYELVPASRYPLYTAAVTVVVALAFSLGPVLGGVITDRASWRWVFLLKYATTHPLCKTYLKLTDPAKRSLRRRGSGNPLPRHPF
jgi:MFS family permease